MTILLIIYCLIIGIIFGGTAWYAFSRHSYFIETEQMPSATAFQITAWIFTLLACLAFLFGVYALFHPMM